MDESEKKLRKTLENIERDYHQHLREKEAEEKAKWKSGFHYDFDINLDVVIVWVALLAIGAAFWLWALF